MPALARDHSSWLRRFATVPPGTPTVLCLPHAGGAASAYVPMARLLAPRVGVVAVQYPGRQDRRAEPGLHSVPELADHIVDVLDGLEDAPLALFGHSMGAFVGFEVARRLETAGVRRPIRLFASGQRAPSRRRRAATVHDKDDATLLAAVGRLNGTRPEILADSELVRLALPALRCDYRAVETYTPTQAQLSCPLTVLTGDADPQVTQEDAESWAAHTTGGCEVEVFPGGHFFLDAQRQAVAALIQGRIRVEEGTDTCR